MDNKFVYPSEGEKQNQFGKKYIYNEGITKREYFAGLAMQGLLSNSSILDLHTESAIDWIARHSVLQADALLLELSKTE